MTPQDPVDPPGAKPPGEDLVSPPAADPRAPARAVSDLPAPGLGALLTQSLAALLRAPCVFDDLAGRPPPSWGVMVGNLAVFFGAQHAALAVLGLVAASPVAARVMAGYHAAAFAAALVLSFALAALVEAVARLGGAEGGYARSYEIVSTASAAALLGMVVPSVPQLWFLPTAWALFVLGFGVERVHGARRLPTWALALLIGGAALFGQWEGRKRLARAAAQVQAADAAMTEFERLRSELQKALPDPSAFEQARGQAPDPQPPSGPLSPPDKAGQTPAMPMAPLIGSLDLAAPPGGGQPGPAGPALPGGSPEAFMQANMSMLKSLAPMIRNPAYTKSLSPEQAQQMAQLSRILEILERGAGPNGKMSDQDVAQLMQFASQMQATMMKRAADSMGQLPGGFPLPPAPAGQAQGQQGAQGRQGAGPPRKPKGSGGNAP